MRKIKAYQTRKFQSQEEKESVESELSSEVMSEIFHGFSALASLTSNVLFQSAFKYAYPYVEGEDQQNDAGANGPTSAGEGTAGQQQGQAHNDGHKSDTNPSNLSSSPNAHPRKQATKKPKISEDVSVTPEALPYALAVKYNYDNHDRAILIDYIAMIKGISSLLVSASSLVLPIIRAAIHQQLQEFVQFDLRKIIRKFSKPKTKKKPAHEDVLKLLYVELRGKKGEE